MTRKRVLVAYNAPIREQRGRDIDYVSEAGVLDQVRSVESALLSKGYEVAVLALRRSIRPFVDEVSKCRPDAVFNLVEGWRGDSRLHLHFPGLYELLGFEYTGSPTTALALTADKWVTKLLLAQAGLPVPRGMLCQGVPADCDIPYPLIVKPVFEDASLGIDFDAVVHTLEDVQKRTEWVLQKYQQPALVEQYVDGRELNVSVVGDRKLEVLPISEITFPFLPENQPRICSYNIKWIESSPEFHSVEAACPAPLDAETTGRLGELAVSAFRLLRCRDYARVDMRLSADNQPYIVEVNANPDLSPDAGLTRSAMASGRSHVDLVGEIVTCALRRGQENGHSSAPKRGSASH